MANNEMIRQGIFSSIQQLKGDIWYGHDQLELDFDALAQQYWVCDPIIDETVQIGNSLQFNDDYEEDKETNNSGKKSKTIRIASLSFETELNCLIESLDMFSNPEEVIFFGHKKGKDRVNASTKRSSFIGVCKNGPHWQALISIRKKKTYVGTYPTQVEAARAYDFYCMLVHWLRAKTNFGYTKAEVDELIASHIETIRI